MYRYCTNDLIPIIICKCACLKPACDHLYDLSGCPADKISAKVEEIFLRLEWKLIIILRRSCDFIILPMRPCQFIPILTGLLRCLTDCPAGKYLATVGNDAVSDCINCPIGKFSAGGGSSSCTTCAAGKYGTAKGAVSCDSCPSRSTSIGGGNYVSCQCNAGYTGPDGSGPACRAARLASISAFTGQYLYKVNFSYHLLEIFMYKYPFCTIVQCSQAESSKSSNSRLYVLVSADIEFRVVM